MNRAIPSLENGCGWGFAISLACAPVIFGGNVALAWSLNALLFGFWMLLYVGIRVLASQALPLELSRLFVPCLAFFIVASWIALQTASWLPRTFEAPEWGRVAQLLDRPISRSISVNPSETGLGLLRFATAFAVFFVAAELGRSDHWSRRLVITVAIAAAAQALFAFSLRTIGPEAAKAVLAQGPFKLDQQPHLTGTFINRNHFAIYLGLGFVCLWGLLLKDLKNALAEKGLSGNREPLAKLVAASGSLMRYSVLFVLVTSALLLTGSRAAIVLTTLAIILMLLLKKGRSPAATAMKKTAAVILLAGGFAAIVSWGDVIGAKVVNSSAHNDVDSRLAVAAISLRAIADRPHTGFGYATFADVFQYYRDDSIPLTGTWREAHNSYLEALMGLGVPVASILFFALIWIAWRCLHGAINRRRGQLAPMVAVGAIVIVALHALVDFSIQIGGIALTVAALLGVGYSQSWSTRQTTGRE